MSRIANEFETETASLIDGFEDDGMDLSSLCEEMDTFVRELSVEEQVVAIKYFKELIVSIVNNSMDAEDEDED